VLLAACGLSLLFLPKSPQGDFLLHLLAYLLMMVGAGRLFHGWLYKRRFQHWLKVLAETKGIPLPEKTDTSRGDD
jgi:uncharacterized membrane protein YbaN (DUF454 family)